MISGPAAKKNLLLATLIALLASCTRTSYTARQETALTIATQAGWQQRLIPTSSYTVASFEEKIIDATTTQLSIYIEGDGMAWRSRREASANPTPINPIALKLAVRQPHGRAVYLARPCQYVTLAQQTLCEQSSWTGARYSEVITNAMNEAVSEIKHRYRASSIVLVGYSGGGTIAALVAARRDDVALLVTIAANLDIDAWARDLHLSPLGESLNPVDYSEKLSGIDQLHFSGSRDQQVPTAVLRSYSAQLEADSPSTLVELTDFDHHCCWAEQWPDLWSAWITRPLDPH